MRLTLARPCPLKQGELPTQGDRTWFCSQCKESVYDLSSMGPEAASALLQERAHAGEEVCGQWVADADGRVMFNLTRAAAAAAAVFMATPALADGDDVAVPDVVEFLLHEAAETNRAHHDATRSDAADTGPVTDADGGGEHPLEPAPRRYLGRMAIVPSPPSNTP